MLNKFNGHLLEDRDRREGGGGNGGGIQRQKRILMKLHAEKDKQHSSPYTPRPWLLGQLH